MRIMSDTPIRQQGGYPTKREFSRLVKAGLVVAAAGSLASCVQQQQWQLGGAPLPPPPIVVCKGK